MKMKEAKGLYAEPNMTHPSASPKLNDDFDEETLELLNDAELMDDLEKAKQDRENGVYEKWEDIKR